MIETVAREHWVLDNDLELKGFNEHLDEQILSVNNKVDLINRIKEEEILESIPSTISDNEILNFNFENPFRPTPYFPRVYNKRTQNWHGEVIELQENGFIAKLTDPKSKNGTYEIAEFEKIEISKSDIKLIKLGALFYYSLGFTSFNGQIKKEAFIRFRRSIPFTLKDIEEIEEKVNRQNENLNWD